MKILIVLLQRHVSVLDEHMRQMRLWSDTVGQDIDMAINIKKQMDNCPKVTPSAAALAAHGGGSLEICGAELSPY